jgi:hypothetical protein
MIERRAIAILPLLLLAACAATSEGAAVVPAAPRAGPGAAEEAVLYARDGSVVSPSGGERPDGGAPIHGAEPRGESRLQMLDLYQRVVGEKDAMAKELRELDQVVRESRAAQEGLARERDEQRARITALEAELAKADQDRYELAARLTTAQIRRLEAEKLLLETRLALARASDHDAWRTTQASPASARESGPKNERGELGPFAPGGPIGLRSPDARIEEKSGVPADAAKSGERP